MSVQSLARIAEALDVDASELLKCLISAKTCRQELDAG